MFKNIPNTTKNQLAGNFADAVIWSVWLNELPRTVSFFMSILSQDSSASVLSYYCDITISLQKKDA